MVGATLLSFVLMLTATLAPPGYALDPATNVPVGDLFPGTLRLLTPFMNITGGLVLILGAVFSTYVFMPKRRVLDYSLDPEQTGDQFLFNLLIAPVAIVGQLRRLDPARVPRLPDRPDQQPRPGDGPHRDRRHPRQRRRRLNRFGITEYFQVGKFLAVLFLLAGFLVSIEVFREIRIPFTAITLRAARPDQATDTAGD